MTLTLEEVAEQIGLAPGTIRNRRTRGEFAWMRSDGRTLTADVEDVATYIEQTHKGVVAARNADAVPYLHPPPARQAGRRRRLP